MSSCPVGASRPRAVRQAGRNGRHSANPKPGRRFYFGAAVEDPAPKPAQSITEPEPDENSNGRIRTEVRQPVQKSSKMKRLTSPMG